MSRALVTGATGFLGQSLCRRLRSDGWSVTALARPSSDREVLGSVDVEWAVADVLDGAALEDAVQGHEYVFHLAGAGLLDADEETVRKVNGEGTRNVLAASQSAGVERLLFASTSGTRWRADGLATEADQAAPLGAYQESKAAAEALVDQAARSGQDVVTVHPTSVFGPGDESFTGRLLSLATDWKMMASLPGGASFVHVEDVTRGMVLAMTEGEAGEHYILGGENLTYREALDVLAHQSDGSVPRFRVPALAIRAAGPVVGLVNDAFGTQMFPVNGDMATLATRELFCSSAKARADLGYDPRPLRAYATDAIDWYLESPPMREAAD